MQPISIQGAQHLLQTALLLLHDASSMSAAAAAVAMLQQGHWRGGCLLADITPPPPCPFLQARPKTGVSGTKVAAPGFSSSFTLTGAASTFPSFLIGTLSLCLPAPARALPDKWAGEWEQTNDGTTRVAPDRPNWGHAFCLPGHNNGPVITMILVKITVPFMMETLITMMRTWACDRMA